MRRILKTAVALIASLALALTVTIAAELPASAASNCKTTFNKYSKIKHGSKGSKVRAAQCLLRSAGYKVKADGSFSAADVRKLKAFQKSRKLSQSGTITSTTWTALLARGSKPTLRVGDSGSSVKRLQNSLTASGRKVPATGYYGSMTKSAVKSVQRSQGWKATGTATSNVWRALQAGAKAKVSSVKASSAKVAKKKPAAKKSKKKASSSSKGNKAVAFAKKQIGDRYRYGGTGPNAWDCSGLTGGAWKAAGVKLPRTSQAQFRFGKKVAKSHLKKGDLVFFYSGISHVAIYAGGGKVIHASQPGKPVATLPMKYMPYKGARRPA
ncbi:MAG: peptidoglycan DL-endopeptidase CwlO [Propionibacteriaceae bacterium]|jgi:cell wall-associated NlpC family hydrolase|nr:hypothetical protein [Propionibacteriaceae bacterium]MDX6323278.1 peptidoglycan DL-endopeptidase CwlO [Propionibacteriaceae bacterium]